MKTKLILSFILITVIPVLCSAQIESGADSAPTNRAGALSAPVPDQDSSNAPPSPAPLAPNQVLQEYEAAMVAISQNFSAKLTGIDEAVQQGTMSSEEAKNTSTEQYLLAQMQLQLLSAWRQMEEQDQSKASAPGDKSAASPTDDNQIVLVELPSSFKLTEGVAAQLSLTQSQKEAIQQVMTRERHRMEPLMEQLRSAREKLLAIDPQHSNKKETKSLADAQAALLVKIIVANARMQLEIYRLLTPEQQKKLDDLKRDGESGTVASR